MAKARERNHKGAMSGCILALELPELTSNVQSMLLYNRALVYVAIGEEQLGAQDLDAILRMKNATGYVQTLSRQKLARMKTRSDKRSQPWRGNDGEQPSAPNANGGFAIKQTNKLFFSTRSIFFGDSK